MEQLKEYRKRFGLSNQEMADMLSISKTFYWQLEHNQRRLSYSMAMKIAAIFDEKPDVLFYEEMKARLEKN